MTRRPRAELTVDRETWLALDAWRSGRGLGLVYFLHLEDGTPGDPASDRRAPLPPDADLSVLDAAELHELWAGAVELTPTERRLVAPDGSIWLAQGTGPAWSDGGAVDAIGVRLRCLSDERPIREIPGLRISEATDSRLEEAISRAG